MRLSIIFLLLFLISSCSPRRENYCIMKGAEPYTPEFSECVRYYNQQQEMFGRDEDACMVDARKLYPDSLYDRGFPYRYTNHTGMIMRHNMFDDNFEYNAELDRQRRKVVVQCLHDKGWKSAKTWMAGRNNPQ